MKVRELKRERSELREVLKAFVAARKMAGWKEGRCDDWLGPIWERANDALKGPFEFQGIQYKGGSIL